jgi:hypothetical protein
MHEVVVTALAADPLRERIDALIREVLAAGHGTPAEALPNLEDADSDVVEFDRRLARQLGFKNRYILSAETIAMRELQRALDRKLALTCIETTSYLVEDLADLRHYVVQGYAESVVQARRPKTRRRKDVSRYVDRRLYIIGAVLSNAAYAHVFSYSYAMTLGLSLATPRRSIRGEAEGSTEAA